MTTPHPDPIDKVVFRSQSLQLALGFAAVGWLLAVAGPFLAYQMAKPQMGLAVIDPAGSWHFSRLSDFWMSETVYDEAAKNVCLALLSRNPAEADDSELWKAIFTEAGRKKANKLLGDTAAYFRQSEIFQSVKCGKIQIIQQPDRDHKQITRAVAWCQIIYTYDASGNLLRQYDPVNPTMQATYTYDAAGNRLTQTDSLGHTTHYAYDNLGRVTSVTDPLGNQTITTYTGALVTQVETGRTSTTAGRIVKYTYDQAGRRTQTIRSDGSGDHVQQATTYDADGNVVAETNALGQATTYQYDSNDRQISVTQPYGAHGSTTTMTYDNSGNLLTQTGPTGVVTQNTYDSSNRLINRTEAVGLPQQRSTSYQYDAMNRVTQTAYSDGTNTFTTHYAYDALGRRTSISGQREYPQTFTYDANDNVLTQTDARGNTTSYVYDAYNRQTQVNAPSQTTSSAYDLDGNLISQTDGNNITRGFAYDALNRQVAQSVPMASLPSGWVNTANDVISSSTYDAWGEATTTANLAGGTTSATYDSFGRRTASTDAAGLSLSYVYNALDQITSVAYPPIGSAAATSIQYVYDGTNGQLLDSVTDRAGDTTTYQYDARSLKTQETASNGAVTQYVYDPLGRLFQQTDALNETTLWGYDQFDQVTQTVYPDSTTQNPRVATATYDAWGKVLTQAGTGQYPVTYAYDVAGNRTSLTDGNNHTTHWSYDGLNRVTTKTYADGSTYVYTYDPAGNLATRTDALGRETQYAYNAYNQVGTVTYPTNPAVNFSYDALGRRTSMTDASGTTTWAWDSAGRNTGATQSAIGQGLAYSYDAESHRTQMGVGPINGSVNWTTQYGYDASGRLSTILDGNVSATSPFTYAYQNGTNWISGHSNADGSAVINQYDVLGRLTRISAANGAGAAINTYGYSYDTAGQRTQESSSVGTRNFAYDNQRELTNSTNVNGSNQPIVSSEYSYLYDSIGNLQKKTTSAGELDVTANNLNQYTQLSGTAQPTPLTPSYDANGNMTSDGNGHTYIYDEENRLIEVDNATAVNGVVKTVNVYDGLSRRIEKDTYASGNSLLSTIRYLYDGNLPIAEYDASNTLLRSYTRGLDLSATLQSAGGIGGLLAMANADGNSYSYFCDGNGNVVDLTDEYGNSAAHYQYDPFGHVIANTGSLQQNYQWSSQETDASTGLAYYLYRFYNPTLGRWTSRDPISEEGGLNIYNYIQNSPPNDTDAYGLARRGTQPRTEQFDLDILSKQVMDWNLQGWTFAAENLQHFIDKQPANSPIFINTDADAQKIKNSDQYKTAAYQYK